MKNNKLIFGLLSVVLGAALLLIGGCAEEFKAPDLPQVEAGEEFETVTFVINDGSGRTLLPGYQSFSYYTLTFTAYDGQTPVEPVTAYSSYETVTLGKGSWYVSVKAYKYYYALPGLEEGHYEAASGGNYFTTGNGNGTVNVSLFSAMSGDKGVFEWEIRFPDNVEEAVMNILDVDEGAIDGLDQIDLFTGSYDYGYGYIFSYGSIALDSGYYMLKVELTDNYGNKAYKTEIMHIHSSIITSAGYSGYLFDSANFARMTDITGLVHFSNVGFSGSNPRTITIYRDSGYIYPINAEPIIVDADGTWSYSINSLYGSVYPKVSVNYATHGLWEVEFGPLSVTSYYAPYWNFDARLPETEIVISVPPFEEWDVFETVVNLTEGEEHIFEVSGGETYTAYAWYLDGNPVGTEPTYTFNQPYGVYDLTLILTRDDGQRRSLTCTVGVGVTVSDGSNEAGRVEDYSYTGDVQAVTLRPGTYELEVWGANGGARNGTSTSRGGYSKGTITVSSTTTYYIVVGESGGNTGTAKFNGGGTGGGGGGSSYLGGAGGGATHIATRTGQLSTLESYQSDVIIVAGGAGGKAGDSAPQGGHGGGLIGGNGEIYSSSYTVPTGGTQTAGGTGGRRTDNTGTPGTNGSFGQGGNASGSQSYGGGGGGGGWYGGGGGCTADDSSGGGGGSGYIGGVTSGVTAQSGAAGFVTNPDASGNGFARITVISGSIITP